jgi:hypothetical protein
MDSVGNQPTLFSGNSSFAQDVTRGIVRSEIEGGVYMSELQEGEVLVVETENRSYRIELRAGRAAFISGHPTFCPRPTRVSIHGSTWGGSMLKASFIGRGMRLEFHHPEHKQITTSMIVDIRQASAA